MNVYRSALSLTLILLLSVTQASDELWENFQLDSGHIKVPVYIQGHRGYGILDTGAAVNGVSENFLTANAITLDKDHRILIDGIYESEKRWKYKDVPVTMFGATVPLDLTSIRFGRTNAVLLGVPLFDKFIFQIDYPNRRLRALPRHIVKLKDYENINAERDRKSDQLVVKVKFNNEKSGWVLLDTGFNGALLLDRGFVKRMGWLEEFKTTVHQGGGVLGSGQLETFVLPELKFGPYTLANIKVSVPAEGEKSNVLSHGRRTRLGLLGFDILKHFMISIDYQVGDVYIEIPKPVKKTP